MNGQKLLVANRGEIALRIIRTARALGLRTVAIYIQSDALSPHVTLASEAVALPTSDLPGESGSQPYTNGPTILAIAKARSVTLIHPGYGFLSENSEFASLVTNAGITWVGPRPSLIEMMGIKHKARKVAVEAGLPIIPGSTLLVGVEDALECAKTVGFPIILKATAGGGGMGMNFCANEDELRERFVSTSDRAKILFGNGGLFLERYLLSARHIEIQVFGNGNGDVVHMGERECSLQRRHQKIIEEAPSPFLEAHPGLREKMCNAAVSFCRLIRYNSAGTVEFLVDDDTAQFYFLEMNSRIQVEHSLTEVIHSGLDLVQLMIQHSIAERHRLGIANGDGPGEINMHQSVYDAMRTIARDDHHLCHAIEGRVYAEDPSENFMPRPGLLQHVHLNSHDDSRLRVEGYVSTGMTITPFSDALLVKLIVTADSRAQAITRFTEALQGCKIFGPPNSLEYLKTITASSVFHAGTATTTFLDNFPFTPRAFKVLSSGIECTVQDYPGRTIGLGIPRSGPMDSLAFRAGNILVGNPPATEGLEIVILPGVDFALEFFVPAVIAVTGKEVSVQVNGRQVDTWSRIIIPCGGKLRLDLNPSNGTYLPGFRTYLSVRGGFPNVPTYLGSKSTSMGLGGYQGRSLMSGDQLALGECGPKTNEQPLALPRSWVPKYPSEWIVYVLSGPHDTEEFVTTEGIKKFYSSKFHVSPASNRMGIRLEAPEMMEWARTSGGEGGSHPSNILDNAYAHATININGDTPVILTHEGPDMGGYLCFCTVASAETWKLGQISPGSTLEFRRVSWRESIRLNEAPTKFLAEIETLVAQPGPRSISCSPYTLFLEDTLQSPVLHVEDGENNKVVFRQAGDSSILVEFGPMHLDLILRARIHAFELHIKEKNVLGVLSLRPCIRSTMCDFDPNVISQDEILEILVAALKAVPDDVTGMSFSARRITFPVVLDDRWNREALARYMGTIRKKAVYLPSNIDYLARNNGLSGGLEMLGKMMASDWIVIGVGFYLACAFLVPIDPRCRLVGQKMNPSRTFTPRGAMGIGGPVSVVYPVESPGGYQLYGRALPTWQTWGKGKDFELERPWILLPFDQVHLEPVTEEEYIKLEQQFDSGQYSFKIEPTIFSMKEHAEFVESVKEEVETFLKGRNEGIAREEQREREYLREWEKEKRAYNAETSTAPDTVGYSVGHTITICAPLFASVWKMKCQQGDVIQSGDEVVVVLEAMKTEIPIHAGEAHVGKSIKLLAIREGEMVQPGDVLVILD